MSIRPLMDNFANVFADIKHLCTHCAHISWLIFWKPATRRKTRRAPLKCEALFNWRACVHWESGLSHCCHFVPSIVGCQPRYCGLLRTYRNVPTARARRAAPTSPIDTEPSLDQARIQRPFRCRITSSPSTRSVWISLPITRLRTTSGLKPFTETNNTRP
jgi:hypothetical protein